MKISIAAKLFFGFLVVIFLNVFFVVVVSKLTNLNSIATILKHQNEIKNGLLRVNALHGSQKRYYLIYDRLRRKESADYFQENGRELREIIDTLGMHVHAVREIDSMVTGTIPGFSREHQDLREMEYAIADRIPRINTLYQNYFKGLVELENEPRSARTRERERDLKNLLESHSDSLAQRLIGAEAMLDRQNAQRIREIEERIENVLQLTLLILAGMSVFALLFGMVFSRAITTSLRRLKESASSIAKGDFNFDPSGYPGDEIGDLAQAFFDMAYDLKNAQEELVKSKRMAAIGEVVASVNHEINNPLMIISGNAQFLEMHKEHFPIELRERIHAIIEETERISRVTRKLREIRNPVVENYTNSGEQMINLDKSTNAT